MEDGCLNSKLNKMPKKISIIHYGSGNLGSIVSAINFLGHECEIVSEPEKIKKSKILILPGVGSFKKAIESIKSKGIDTAIKDNLIDKNNKILGICLGMQLLAKSSTENGNTLGMGLIPAKVDRFQFDSNNLKIPHIGFNIVHSNGEGTLFKNINPNSYFYFVHSYRINEIINNSFLHYCNYGSNFIAAYENQNIFATQFHPEKSQTNGLMLLNNFIQSN